MISILQVIIKQTYNTHHIVFLNPEFADLFDGDGEPVDAAVAFIHSPETTLAQNLSADPVVVSSVDFCKDRERDRGC